MLTNCVFTRQRVYISVIRFYADLQKGRKKEKKKEKKKVLVLRRYCRTDGIPWNVMY